MSYWYCPKNSQIELSKDKKNIEAWLFADDNGNVYVEIPVKKIKELLKEIK